MALVWWHKPGQRVVCIDGSFRCRVSGETTPVKDSTFAMLAETPSPGVESVDAFWMRERLALAKRQGGADR